MFLGQGPLAEFAYAQLLDLAEEGADLRVMVACSNQCGEGTWWGTAGVRELASTKATRFITNARRNDSLLAESASEHSVNCLISVGHPWILPEQLLRPPHATAAFNLHNGPLPRFGGFHTGSHAILEGASHFGATLHWMEPEPDAGPIAFEESFEMPGDVTARALHELTLESGRRLFTRLVDCLRQGRLPPRVPMTGSPTMYARHALSEHREIRDITDDLEVDRKARAFWFPPFEPAFHCANGSRYYVVPSRGLADMGIPAPRPAVQADP